MRLLFLLSIVLTLVNGLKHNNLWSINKKLLAVGLSGYCLTFNTPVIAAVGEGDLPEGAMAQSKLIKYQNEWNKVANSVKTRGNDMDLKEQLGLKQFLKQLANEYYDMELLTKGIVDTNKKEQAKLIATDFRTKIRECDDAITDGNINKITDIYPVTSKELKDFFLLLQDIPDEL
jgi:hypothetical protein